MQSHDVDFQIRGEDVQFVEIELDPGETFIAEAGAMLRMELGINYSIEVAGNVKSMVVGGEGAFPATLTGTGWVWPQSLPFSKRGERIVAAAPRASGGGGQSIGENTLGNIFEW